MKKPRARFNLIVAPPSSHCQKRTHLGFSAGHSSAGAVEDARGAFLSRFYFSVCVKERKKEYSVEPKLGAAHTCAAVFAHLWRL